MSVKMMTVGGPPPEMTEADRVSLLESFAEILFPDAETRHCAGYVLARNALVDIPDAGTFLKERMHVKIGEFVAKVEAQRAEEPEESTGTPLAPMPKLPC